MRHLWTLRVTNAFRREVPSGRESIPRDYSGAQVVTNAFRREVPSGPAFGAEAARVTFRSPMPFGVKSHRDKKAAAKKAAAAAAGHQCLSA